MIVFIGLGNPGQKFQKTRHNVGFGALDEFQKKNNFPDFKVAKKFLAEISEGILGKEKVVLAKPQTFMNESGKAVKLLTKNYKLPTTNLLVVHDDLDLPLGKIKIAKNRGSGGHKGVESIIKELKTKNFVRLRIGICPKNKIRMGAFAYPSGARRPERGCAIRMQKFVLESFKKEEEKIIKETIDEAAGAIETIINEGLEKTMNEYN